MTENNGMINDEEEMEKQEEGTQKSALHGFYTGIDTKSSEKRVEVKVRRKRKTGMLTLGISLILVGAAALAAGFVKSFDMTLLIKWSPVILILLGAEIIYGSFKEGEEYSVNFWCAAMCMVLFAASVCAALVPDIWDAWGPKSQERSLKIEAQFSDRCYEELKDSDISFLRGRVFLYGERCESLDELAAPCSMEVEIMLDGYGDYESAGDFAAAAEPVIKTIVSIVPNSVLESIDISSRVGENGGEYRLYLNNRWLMDEDAESLKKRVEVTEDTEEEENEYEEDEPPVSESLETDESEALPESMTDDSDIAEREETDGSYPAE